MRQTNIILTGVGGQGIVKAGQLIGRAVASTGANVVMSEIHGMSQRGGIVGVDLRIGNVYGPIIPDGAADLLIGFEAVETLRALGRVGKNTTILMSTEKIAPVSVNLGDSIYPDTDSIATTLREKGARLYKIDAPRLAGEAGNVKSTNVVLVGAAYSAGFIPVPISALKEALRSVFPERSWASNLRSLELGIETFKMLSSIGEREVVV
jgi:indolepyruvate ferredoxin oxidoreductase beta subunit